MPNVHITQAPRSLERKRRLIAAVTEVFVKEYDVRPDQISVFFHELDGEAWGSGGRLACDRETATADHPVGIEDAL